MIEPANGLTVEGDRLRLEQALTNLVENAIEHGGGQITIRVREDRRRGGDSRRGPRLRDSLPDFVGRAFERFSRGDASRGGDGTGLGLAIVDAIARAHSRQRPRGQPRWQGADVWIELPADRA